LVAVHPTSEREDKELQRAAWPETTWGDSSSTNLTSADLNAPYAVALPAGTESGLADSASRIYRRSDMRLADRVGVVGVVVASLACSSTAPTSPTDQVRALAPIEQVDINVAESFPPQYFVAIVSLQPNSCVSFDAIETTRDGNSIRILVWNLVPDDPDVLCAQVVSMTAHNVALGSDFKPGQSYDVQVNDVTRSFVAQ
jgi:hypothetical protein